MLFIRFCTNQFWKHSVCCSLLRVRWFFKTRDQGWTNPRCQVARTKKKIVLWCLIFVCLQWDTCFMSNLCTPVLENRRCPRNLVVLSINLRKREVKNVQKIAHVHSLQICERLDGLLVQIHSFLTSELVESEWLGSSLNPLPAGGKELRSNGIRCWVGTWEGTYALEKRKYLATLRGSNLVSSVVQPITYRKKILRKTKFKLQTKKNSNTNEISSKTKSYFKNATCFGPKGPS